MRWTIWWLAIFAIYLAEVTVSAQEIVAGAIISTLCTLLLASALRGSRLRVPLPWLRYLARVPMAMLRDVFVVSWRVLRSLFSGEELVGLLTRIPFDCGPNDSALDRGREALVVLAICAAPNTLVADVDSRGTLLIHELIAAPLPHRSDRWPL